MGGGEFSFASSAAIRAGGGHDGLTKNGYVSAGISVLSADVGSIDLGLRQDISGSRKATMVGISARLFVPSM
jgi:methylaspartate ammonia-lyase